MANLGGGGGGFLSPKPRFVGGGGGEAVDARASLRPCVSKLSAAKGAGPGAAPGCQARESKGLRLCKMPLLPR